MTAVEALVREAAAAGVVLAVTDQGLSYRARAGALTAELRAQLRDNKAAVTAHLRAAADSAEQAAPDGADWRDDFEERAGILEHNAELPRAEAEAMAREAAIARWMNTHPPEEADQNHCAACGDWLLDDMLPLAERDQLGRPVWVHGQCWSAYLSQRRAAAERALFSEGTNDA